MNDLMTYARMRCNIEQNNVIQDSELMLYLNMSLGNLDTVLATDYEDYHVQTYLATITGGSTGNYIPLPADFFKLRAVDFGSPGAWTTVYNFQLPERNRYNNPIANMFAPYGNQAARKVRVMDNKIVVEPDNIASGQYQVWYTPKYTFITDPLGQLPVYMDMQGFIEYAVASAGIKIYNKLTLSPAGFIEEMKYYEDLVRNGAKNRMSSGPKCVANVRNINDASYPYLGGGWGC